MSENNDYWMFTASILFFACYLPDIYANIRNRNANMYNVPEKILITAGTICALVYSVQTKNTPLITNYAPLLFLDIISLSMRFYYAILTHYYQEQILPHTKDGMEILDVDKNNHTPEEKNDETYPFDIENCGKGQNASSLLTSKVAESERKPEKFGQTRLAT